MSESCFILDHTMNLYLNFHEVALAQGDSYTELSEWIAKEKEGSNPKSNNRQCFKSSTNIKAKGLWKSAQLKWAWVWVKTSKILNINQQLIKPP